MYETAVHGGERLDFAQNEDSKVPQEDERIGGSSFGISQADQLSQYHDDSSDDNDSVSQRTRFPFHSTKNQKRENGEDIEQGSSLVIVLRGMPHVSSGGMVGDGKTYHQQQDKQFRTSKFSSLS